MDRLVVDIVGDALAWMSYHVLSYLWSSMNYVCAKLRGHEVGSRMSPSTLARNVTVTIRKKW